MQPVHGVIIQFPVHFSVISHLPLFLACRPLKLVAHIESICRHELFQMQLVLVLELLKCNDAV